MKVVKIVFKRDGKIGLALLIVFVFAMAGLVFSSLVPKVIYPGESNSQYAAQVQFLFPVSQIIFFIIGLSVSMKITTGKYPKIIKKTSSSFPIIHTRVINSNKDGGETREVDPILALENKLNFYRDEASRDPLKLPDLAKRLLALSMMYKDKDQDKFWQYLEEAKSILSSSDYPNNRDGKEIRKLANRLLKYDGT